jgi:hypothetical protein
MKKVDENVKSYMAYVLQEPSKNTLVSFLGCICMVGIPTVVVLKY